MVCAVCVWLCALPFVTLRHSYYLLVARFDCFTYYTLSRRARTLGLCVIYDAWCFPSGVRVIALFFAASRVCVNLCWFRISRARMHRVEMETESWQFDHGARCTFGHPMVAITTIILYYSINEKRCRVQTNNVNCLLWCSHIDITCTHASLAPNVSCTLNNKKIVLSRSRQNVGPFRIEDDRTSSKYLCYETKWSDNVPYTDFAFSVRRSSSEHEWIVHPPTWYTSYNWRKEWWASDDAETFGIYKFFLSANWDRKYEENGSKTEIENKRKKLKMKYLVRFGEALVEFSFPNQVTSIRLMFCRIDSSNNNQHQVFDHFIS